MKYDVIVNDQFICSLPLEVAVSMALTIWDKSGSNVQIVEPKDKLVVCYFAKMSE